MASNIEDDEFQGKLELLRKDYKSIRGKPFNYFYCPILFRDENVPLCRGHIVNRAFPNSYRVWTAQRKDVDNFFWTYFEATTRISFHTIAYTLLPAP
jgi:hypothetical protein